MRKSFSLSFRSILLIAIAIRLLTLFLFRESFSTDLASFIWSGDVIIDKLPSYPSYYFPFFPYVGAVTYLLPQGIDPLLFLKLLFTLFDVGIVWLIYKISKNWHSAFLYALNPMTIIATTIHGQFDTIPSFFFLLSVYLFNQKSSVFSLLTLSFAIYTKTWPFLFMLPIIKHIKDYKILWIVPVVPLFFLVFHWWAFHISLTQILEPIKGYRGVYSVWGVGFIMATFWPALDGMWIQLGRRVSLLIFLALALCVKRKQVVEEITLTMLIFFAITLTFGAQWLTWLVPWVVVTKPKGWRWFLIVGSIYLCVTFYSNIYDLTSIQMVFRDQLTLILGILTWLTVLFMMAKMLLVRGSERNRTAS